MKKSIYLTNLGRQCGLILLLLSISYVSIAQQYASSVIEFSSQYTATSWSAAQATGVPNVYPTCGDNPKAWASATADGQREWLVLGFSTPQTVDTIKIYETFNPDAVDTVYLRNASTLAWNQVFTQTASAQTCSKILTITIPLTTYQVDQVRIAVNSPAVSGWNEIDAVSIINDSSYINNDTIPTGQTFPCDNGARLYFFEDTGSSGNGSLAYIEDYLTTPKIVTMFQMPSYDHNGLGANPVDHYLYFQSNDSLERIDANGNVTPVCFLNNSIDYRYGCCDPYGRYWAVSDDDASLVALNISNGQIVKGPFPVSGIGSGFLDIVFNPFDCYLYIGNVRCDTNGVVDVSYSGIQFVPSDTYGGVAVGSDGNLYGVGSNNFSVINLAKDSSYNIFNFTAGSTFGESDMASFTCINLTALFSSSDSGSCSGVAAFTDSSLGPVGTWHWNFGDPASGNNDTSTLKNPTHAFSGAGTYTVTLTVSIGNVYCMSGLYSDSITHILTIGSGGALAISAGPDISICMNDSAQINVTGIPGGSTITWSPATGLSCNNCANPVAKPADSTIYIVSVTAPGGCMGKDTVRVNVSPSGNVTASPGDTAICYGNSVQLQASGGATYIWTPTTGLSNPDIANPLATPVVTTTYSVTVSGNCDSSTTAIKITVNTAPPTPVITQSKDTLYCSFDPSYSSYQWYFNSTLIPGATNPYFVENQNGNYNVAVTNENGCTISVGIIILGLEQFTVYSLQFTLSPNPVSDELIIKGNSEFEKGILTIYNMLGEELYTSAMNSKQETVNCKPFSSGIYFVKIVQSQGQGEWIGKLVKE